MIQHAAGVVSDHDTEAGHTTTPAPLTGSSNICRPRSATHLLPERCDSTREAEMQRDVQAADIDAQFQCIGRTHRPQITL